MSLPLHDLGSIKVSPAAHSYLKAKAHKQRLDLTAYVRDLIEAHVRDELDTFTLASEIHKSKGFGEISGDIK